MRAIYEIAMSGVANFQKEILEYAKIKQIAVDVHL